VTSASEGVERMVSHPTCGSGGSVVVISFSVCVVTGVSGVSVTVCRLVGGTMISVVGCKVGSWVTIVTISWVVSGTGSRVTPLMISWVTSVPVSAAAAGTASMTRRRRQISTTVGFMVSLLVLTKYYRLMIPKNCSGSGVPAGTNAEDPDGTLSDQSRWFNE
jgi:hypothetical protein